MRVFSAEQESSVIRRAVKLSLERGYYNQCVFVSSIEQKRKMVGMAMKCMPDDCEVQEIMSRNDSRLIFGNNSILRFIVASENSKGYAFHAICVSDSIPKKIIDTIISNTEICAKPVDESKLNITFDDLMNGVC